MSDREGPNIIIKADCYGCLHCRSEYYAVQGDSGHDVYCDHPEAPEKHVGDTSWRTPEWCPLLDAAMRAAKAA